MALSDNTALRHTPRQVRGQRKVDHIVRSAEALFAEVGFEQATTNAIAARAGISIGSLYQFFASKEAILSAMANRYLDQMRRAVDEGMAGSQGVELEHFLTQMLTMAVKLQEQRPYFLQCLGRSRPSPVLCQAVTDLNDYFAGQMLAILEQVSADDQPKMLRLRARVCIETMGALLPLAVRAKGRDRTLATREIVTVLMRYLGPTLKQRGVA
jgi:AcrR family transcriptional regulator